MLTLSCRITGIKGLIDLPAIEGRKAVLHYTHPLAHVDSLLEVSEEGIKYMRRLDIDILSGMFLATLRYLNAIESKEDSLFLNVELQKAGKGALLHTTKALLDYVVPVHSFNRKAKAKLVKSRLEGSFTSSHDARSWIESVVTSIMEEHLNYDDLADYARSLVNANEKKRFMSPAAMNQQLDLMDKAVTARKESANRLLNDAMAKADKLRAAKKAKLETSAAKGSYHKSDLFYSEDSDMCLVEAHINTPSIPRTAIHKKLCASFTRERNAATKLLPSKTNSVLLGISRSLEYMPTAKLKTLYIKMQASDNAEAMANMVRIIELLIKLDAEKANTISMLDDLDNTSCIETTAVEPSTVKANAKMTLLERIQSRKGSAK